MDYIMFPVPENKFYAVCALLGGTPVTNLAAPAAPKAAPVTEKPEAALESATTAEAPVSDENSGKVDAAGTPFDPVRHTGSIVKSGLWRMKAGVARGPGEGEDAIPNSLTGTSSAGEGEDAIPNSLTGTSSAGEVSKATGTALTSDAEEDEFAAFAEASGKSTATDVPARSWSDTDLSKLNNQVAVKLGSADKIKALIAEYVPAGAIQHSRMIPVDKREEYAVKLEAAAGIEFEG